jgi:hypothetical protein
MKEYGFAVPVPTQSKQQQALLIMESDCNKIT